MNILHIHGAAQLAGCERTCELFMDSLPGARHFVLVLNCSGPATEIWTRAGAQVRAYGSVPGRIREYYAISRMARESYPDAAIVWTCSRLGLKVAACSNAGVKRIIVHVGNPIHLSGATALSAEAYTAMPGSRRATLIPVSRHVETSYERIGGFRHFCSRVVHNAADTRQFKFEPKESLPEDLRVGMVARLDPIKDHATLLHAWRIVLQTKPEWNLDFAGDGPLRPQLETLAGDLGVSSRVHFMGWISNIPAIMRKWSIVVHSTTPAEGLGNSTLEAMALGRPLVASGVAPILEITDHGRIARISRPGDPEDLARQILDVANDWPRSRMQVLTAREWLLDHFSPQRMVDEYLSALGY